MSGIFEPEDLENVQLVTAGNRGNRSSENDLLFAAGAHFERVTEVSGHKLPGAVYVAPVNTEHMQRGFYEEWYKRMNDGPATEANPR